MKNAETQKIMKIAFFVIATALIIIYFNHILMGLQMVYSAAYPLLLGCILAFILNIPMKKLERIYFPQSSEKTVLYSRRPICLLLSIAIVILLLVLVFKMVIPEMGACIKLIAQEIPPVIEQIQDWLILHSEDLPQLQQMLQNMDIDWSGIIKNALDMVLSSAGGVVTSVVTALGGILSSVVHFIIGLIFALYILLSKEKLGRQLNDLMQAYIKPSVRDKILYALCTAQETFANFISGQCIEAVILGALCTVGMLIFGFPYAVMTGTVIGVTALVPVVGAYIGAAIGAFMIFTVDPMKALLFLVFLVVLQQIEGNLIYPKVVGSSIGLPGIWVLAAVTIGGGVIGVLGMLLGVPAAATVYKLLRRDMGKRLRYITKTE